MQRILTLTGLGLMLALGACKGGDKQQGAGNAQGEILPGSASDAMLPLDTVRSQAPLAPRAAAVAPGEAQGEATAAAEEVAPVTADKAAGDQAGPN